MYLESINLRIFISHSFSGTLFPQNVWSALYKCLTLGMRVEIGRPWFLFSPKLAELQLPLEEVILRE